MAAQEFIVQEKTDIFQYLLSLGFKRTRVKQLMKYRGVLVNGNTVARHDHCLFSGDRVCLSHEKKAVAELRPNLGLKILYEDDALLVIDKPAGLLTISTEKEKTKTAYFQINEYLRGREPDKGGRVFIVHRLDRETSGLIVFAKTEAVKRRLQESWDDSEKHYLAIVEGVPEKQEDTISGYLNESSTLRVYESKKTVNAKFAVTQYRVLKSSRAHALLEVAIKTGRKHQIRVHVSGIGHPVAGDRKYGSQTDPLKRLALHAYRLSFTHPVTKRRVCFESRPPHVFDKLFRIMTAMTVRQTED